MTDIALLSLALNGIASMTSSISSSHTSKNHTNVNPEKNQKGSVNKGGGGGGGGSGCGKPAPCGKCTKKSKGCGGGGGGCGGSKKQNPESEKFIVIFKDFYGKKVTQEEVEKNGTAQPPWEDSQSAQSHPQGNVPGYTFNRWKESYFDVTSNIEVNPIYDEDLTSKECSPNNILLNETDKQKIENYTRESIDSYNEAVDTCIDNINQTTKYITGEDVRNISDKDAWSYPGMMNVLWPRRNECINWTKFNDTKKCVLNIQSCYIFQTRMLFNNACDQLKDYIWNSNYELFNKLSNGEDISDKLNECKEKTDIMLYDINEDNKIAFTEFKEALSKYIDDINSCFPEKIVQQI